MKKIIISLALMAVVCSPLMAGSFKKNIVPADAKFAMHIDGEAMRKSQLSEFADFLKDDESGLGMKEIIDTLGFDPTKELATLTVYGTGVNIEESSFVLIAETVNPVLSETDIIAKAKAKEGNTIESSIKLAGKNVYSVASEEIGDTSKMMFVDKKTMIVSNSDKDIESAYKTLSAKSGSYAGLSNIPAGSFIAMNISGLDDIQMAPEDPTAAMAQDVKNVVCYIGETGANTFINMTLTTNTAETATGIQQMAQGMLPFMAMSMAQEAPEMAAILQKIKISITGNDVSVKIEHPTKDILTALKKLAEENDVQEQSGDEFEMNISPISPMSL